MPRTAMCTTAETRPEMLGKVESVVGSDGAHVWNPKPTMPLSVVMFGAHMTALGSYWTGQPWTAWRAVSNKPFTATSGGTTCSGGPAGVETTTHEVIDTSSFANHGGAGGPVGSTDTCSETRMFAYRLLAGYANQLDQGSLTFGFGERRARPAPVTHIGNACVLDPSLSHGLAEARSYLAAVGCIPGRVLWRTPIGRAPSGSVIRYEIHGARALLAQPGTRVDLVLAMSPRLAGVRSRRLE